MNSQRILTIACAAFCACAVQAQTDSPLSADLKQMYAGVKTNLTKMAEKMPEEDYGFKATDSVRTFGQLMGHIADSQARTCSAIAGEAKSIGAGTKTSKADLVAALKQSFEMCDGVMDSLTDTSAMKMVTTPRGKRSEFGMLAGMISHSNEEYGYSSVYMRLKGVVPPSSEGR